MNKALIFRSNEISNVYLIGVTHNVIDENIITFLNRTKIDTVIFEDSMPFSYLSDEMEKIAETHYLEIILKSNKELEIFKKSASDVVNQCYNIPSDTEFNITLLKKSYKALDILNLKSSTKIFPADKTSEIAIRNENSINNRQEFLSSNNLIRIFTELQEQSCNLYKSRKYNETFLSHLIYATDTPFYKFHWKELADRNKHWAKNLAENIFPNNNKTIVMFCGAMHLNVFLDDSLISLLFKNHGIIFSCEFVDKSLPSYILENFIIAKKKANEIFQKGELNKAVTQYIKIFDNYKTYCFCGDKQMVLEYLNVLGNIITVYYKQKNKTKLKYYVDMAKKLIVHFEVDASTISIGNKITIAEKSL